ncbi:MAG: Crp/Fnr family transcriptional regulator [Bacteroidota bacterium]
MNKISCKECKTKNCFIQQFCSSDWIDVVDQKKYYTVYKQGQNIIHEGAPVLGIYFVQDGKVKVLSNGITGRQQIVRFANNGHILGHKGIGNDIYPISAVAMEDSQICFVENNTLHDLFMNNPQFTYGVMMFYSRELRKIEERIKNIAQMNIREKIAETLLLINENFGVNANNELNVHFTREDIAAVAGTTSEQVVRQFTDFEEEGLIAKKGRKIEIINLDKLKKVIKDLNPHTIRA